MSACMKYDEKLVEIVKKYGFLDEGSASNKIFYEISNILKEKCKGKRMAMWGIGDINNPKETYAYKFMETYVYFLGEIVCMVDAREDYQGKKMLDIPITNPDSLEEYDVSVVLITSFRSRKYIAKDIRNRFPDIYCLDIYEELEKRGVKTDKDIFANDSKYIDIFYLRKAYEEADNFIDKGLGLRKLIAKYLEIRDIYYVLYFIDEFINNQYEGYEEVLKSKQEIEELLAEIKDNISKKDDIVIAFVDAFRAIDWYDKKEEQFKLLKNISKNSKCFVNSSATGPVTYESMYSIMTGKMPLEGKIYNNKYSFDVEESEFFNEAVKRGYKINNYFNETYKIMEENENVKQYIGEYLTFNLWRLICNMAEKQSKNIHFFYAIELHIPFICGYLENEPIETVFSRMGLEESEEDFEKVSKQFENCLEYINLEINYFWDFLSEDMRKIIFSDHSHIVNNYKKAPYYMYYNDIEQSVHNVFMISGKNIEPGIIKDLVSMRDFNKILLPILDDKDCSVIKRDVVQYEYYPVMNKSIRECSGLFGGEKYIDGIKCFRNEKNLVVFTPNGKVEMYDIDKENKTTRCEDKESIGFLQDIKENYDLNFD